MDQLQNQRAGEQYHRRQSSAGSGSSPGGGGASTSLNTTVQTAAKPDFQSIMKEHGTPDTAQKNESLETT